MTVLPSEPTLPYWLMNVPRDQWPSSCPDFLLNINDKARRILRSPDGDYRRQTWAEVQEIIRTNQLDIFQRVPSDLRRYLAYTYKIKQEYGSVMNFVLEERLRWHDLTPHSSKVPFAHPDDIKILYNDWPYGIDTDIVHLVVWTKFDLDEEPGMNDLTPEMRRLIDGFVKRTFCERVRPDHVSSVWYKKVAWFKNWGSLKSVKAVEHFHVLLYQPDMDFVREITNGDVPLSEQV
ncbi:MAG: hypothetical protein M1816_001031 [Peltula sp. TS41687]|nr:MAG: hypothetical protein M1816_001031 [Peltula sp. TS41687]